MKKLLKIIFSPRTTLGLLVIYAIALAAATFIENEYDTVTAKVWVYNAFWFELVMVLMILNFFGTIKRYHFLTRKKLSGLIFHAAFIIIIVGAAITRYIGYEGKMHIREGGSSDYIFTDQAFLSAKASEGGEEFNWEKPLLLGAKTDNSFEESLEIGEKGNLKIAFKDHIKNAVETFEEAEDGDISVIYLTISIQGHKDEIVLRDGEIKSTHEFPISFNNPSNPYALRITGDNGNLFVNYPEPMKVTAMPAMTVEEYPAMGQVKFETKKLYEPQGSGIAVVMTKLLKNAKIKYVRSKDDNRAPNALLLDVTFNGLSKEVAVLGGPGYIEAYQPVTIEGLDLNLAYGSKKIELPFSLQLNKFELDRYAGSMSPSSYASEVTLIDPNKGLRKDHRIFMNNVLDYGGYRFFQSSYDQDEKGTILSVNHDFAGTMVTYVGYALLIIGFVWTLFNKNSRYWELMGKIRHLREKRKALAVLLIGFLMTGSLVAQENHQHEINPYSVSETHADQFGELIVQTYDGRFAPVHTLAVDVMHKISRKDKFDIPGRRGEMTLMQVFFDIALNAEFWKTQKIIYVREKSVADIIGIKGKYASFKDFFDQNNEFKLKDFSESAFRKAEVERNKFDKELIRLNERIEVFMMTMQGSMLDIFPVQNSDNNKWVSWDDPLAKQPITGSLRIINDDLKLPVLDYHNIMRAYMFEVSKATKTADYGRADKILGYIKSIQRQSSLTDLVPSETKIEREISYNKSNIFNNLKNVYALLSVILLILTFMDNLRAKKNRILSLVLNVAIAFLAVAFVYHTYGMIMRWYLSGHAPWSNGYEALVLVSWSSLLAGFSFMRYSKITLAATALLAFFTLMTAGHSSYDPQLTNLQPVLKSYWLIIHVATLTISYGFLGLGFVLGLFNMGIYLVKNPKNATRLSLISKELTHINEMNLTIGLLLATIGTFLGGVWANESWGRYWGWDAKETWALIITIVYTIILHLRLAPKMKGEFIFNVAAIFGFGSVLMTFIGVNYYFTKGMHSYASGETPVFPMWAWITILGLVAFIVAAGIKQRKNKKYAIE
ncbi:cytochrome c biogenesis protein CcsA [Lutimonas vermicola]|uniref:Cytochrome c biogenesis protein CcsA n=1 Tax=Lutimonas vermicola TaxID=414288 RepID=A0ABU9KY30_9FLAO